MKAILAVLVMIGIASGIWDEIAIADGPLIIESDREIVDFSYSLTGSSIEDTEADGYIVYDETRSEDWPGIRGNLTLKDDGEVVSFGGGVIVDPNNLTLQAMPCEPAGDAVLTIPLWQGRELQFAVPPGAEPYVRSALDIIFWRR